MNRPTHEQLVKMLAKPGEDILEEMSSAQMHLLHMAVGVSGEAGELLDAVKKLAIYQKPLDVANVIEELGDLEFYMEGIRAAILVSREQVLESNITKLLKRYGEKYSNQAAHERADKA